MQVQRLLTSLAEQLQFAIGCDISLFLLQISRRCVSTRGVGSVSCTPLHASSYLDEELCVLSHVGGERRGFRQRRLLVLADAAAWVAATQALYWTVQR